MLIDTISLELLSNTEQWKENGQLAVSDRFFILRNFSFAHKDFLKSSQPYRLQEGRVVIVKKGWAHYAFNLQDYHFTAGDLVVFLSDTLIEKRGHSSDFEVDAFSFDYQSPSLPQLGKGFFWIHQDEHTRPIISQHFNLIWDMAHWEPFPIESVRLLLNSLLLFINRQTGQSSTSPASRTDEMLRRFVSLVSRHAARERSIPFYAGKLCIAPHYLSTLVKQASGRTVMQWVNETAVKEAKVWLAYSDESIAQISDYLHFPCPASFTKFFKRETGLTPSEYRQA
ncbi:MAG: helix-turn-helix transcriptional regulator [Prevotella sp.]|nr:helix-turn-helix transcriptional regulator [Prevotella sp.]